MENMLRWVSNEKVDRMTLWMLRRLFKLFLKKYIGPYIRGELDLEQLDFQLCSAAHLNDIALNADAINAKLGDYPIALKEGSVSRVTVKLMPKLNIEIDGVELRFFPKKAADTGQSKATPSESTSEGQQLESESVGLGSMGGYSYLPVQEGVRVVANLFERLFFGVHVCVNRAFVAIEEMSEDRSSASHCMLLIRVGCAKYTACRSTGSERDRQDEEFSDFTSDISFQQMTLELVDVHGDGCDSPSSMTGGSRVFGHPISLLQDDEGLSGHIKLSIRSKTGSLDIPKMDADVSLAHIKLQFTAQQIQQILRVVSSYGDSDGGNVVVHVCGADINELVSSSSNEFSITKKVVESMDKNKEASASKPAMLGSQSKPSRSSLLPGANLIADWVHWNDQDMDTKEAVISEEEFAASTEEFFDCLSGSGLLMWTCSAFSAISAASSLTSGSVLISQEFARQVTYVVKGRIAGLSIILREGGREHMNAKGTNVQSDLHTMDKKSLISQSVITCSDNSHDYIEAIISNIDLSLQVCQRRWKFQLVLKQIEAYQVKHQEQEVSLSHEPDGAILLGKVSSSAQPLQALVERSVPKFPVSLCEGTETCAKMKKCFLRLSDQGHLAGVQVDAKHKFSLISSDEKSGKSQDLTEIGFHFQPLVVWVDASIIGVLHKWAESCGSPDDSRTTLSGDASSTISSSHSRRRKVHVNMYFSRLRLFACSPYSSGSTFLKDHLLCLDLLSPAENLKRPMVKLRLSDMMYTIGDRLCLGSAMLSVKESLLYLVSQSVNIEGFGKDAHLGFTANKVLSISLCGPELATVEIMLKTKSGGGILLAERAWTGVAEQQKGGTGGRKTNSEFAAATATEAMDENNHKIREDILFYSSICVHVTIPRAKVDLHASEHTVVVGILTALVEASTPQTLDCGNSVEQKDNSQTSILLDVGEAEIVVHPRVVELMNPMSPERKGNNPWESYMINISKLQMLHVVKLGTIKNASYFWLRHGNGCVNGLLLDTSSDALQLLACRDNALGRGDGGGGNALATRSAGVELSVISWPGGGHAEDVLITVTVGGCTFMAHGGRLDWLPGLITFFSHDADKGSVNYAIHERSWGLPAIGTSVVMLQIGVSKEENEASSTDNHVLFSLDLHDAALCYEPGKEAVSAANLRAKSMAEPQASATEQFSPVACSVAAAAIRVSSNAISNTTSKDYEIWLRDVALLLADTTLRRNSALDYTPESLLQAGYVKVAGEAVMEAVVRVNGEGGLGWEVECANNQLRLDTCYDTTAALGRLIAQLQQLFVPEVEHPVMEKSAEHEANTCYSGESFGLQSYNGSTEKSTSDSNLANSNTAVLFEGFLEDAFMFVRGCSLHPESYSCNCLDLEVKMDERFEILSKSALIGDDVVEESSHSSLDQWSRDGVETEDFRTPVSQNEEMPSFIEDYYVTRKSSPQSSQSSSYKDSASVQNFQNPSDDYDMLSTVDGSGGWYDGHSFKVVENHVPVVNNSSGSTKKRGNLHQTSKRRLGLSLDYPQSVGRVIFQDLNLRWRLYGGSDWPASKRKDSVAHSYASQATGGRQVGVCLEVIFHGVNLQHDTFPETGVYASRLALSIRDVGIYDCSKDAPWKKILGYHRSNFRPRESSAKALKLELESVRPDPMVPLEEYRLSVQLLPLLLHLDQRHIDFLINFFPPSPPSPQQLHLGYEEVSSSYSSFDTKIAEGLLPFFQMCELQPFSIRVDYVPRRLDIGALRAGNYAELVNLVSWKGIELELKHVRATGVHGWGTLSSVVVGEWLEDISHNQIHKLLKGLGPIRPLFAVGSGAAKLVVLPAEHYKKDRRRLLRGMRKGAMAFLRSISLEAVGLGVQLAAGAHEILLQTESALGSVGLSSSLEKVEVRAKVGQPGDMREGLQQACESISQGLERTASSLIGNPLKVYHRGAGTSTAVASALRAAPAAAVAPAAAAAGALHRALLGVRNSLDPEHRRESEEKYSGPPPE